MRAPAVALNALPLVVGACGAGAGDDGGGAEPGATRIAQQVLAALP